MDFYALNGDKLTVTEFIEKYGNSYYIDQQRYVSSVAQSSRVVEDTIDELLKNGIKKPIDVVRILAWKIGKIQHSASVDGFVYAKDWKNAEKFEAYLYKKQFDIRSIAEYVANNITHLENEAATDPQKVLCDLRDLQIRGLGTVYMITLLYFISRGKYPIYDRFAMMAVKAISEGQMPGKTVIKASELPGKNDKAFDTVFDDHMKPFISKLNEIFKTAYQESRDVDRALWVYGHAFTAKNYRP